MLALTLKLIVSPREIENRARWERPGSRLGLVEDGLPAPFGKVDLTAHQTVLAESRSFSEVLPLALETCLSKQLVEIVYVRSARGRVSRQQTGCAVLGGKIIRGVHTRGQRTRRWRRLGALLVLLEVNSDG